MKQMRFSAVKSAGELILDTVDGVEKRFAIRVLDMPSWIEYTSASKKHADLQAQIESTEDPGPELTGQALISMVEQLKFFIDITDEDLRGVLFDQVAAMLKYCVEVGVAGPDGESSDEKKPETDGGTGSLA